MSKLAENGAAAPELVELIQFYALRQDGLTLTIESASRQRGWIALEEGEVIHATTAGGKEGVDAFVEIISWQRPNIVQLERAIHEESNVELPLPQLLLDSYWMALDHEPSDPMQAPLSESHGLEEDTVAGDSNFRPPDGVTKCVIQTAQKISEMTGFVAVALISSETMECAEILGDRARLAVPDWIYHVVAAQIADDEFEQALFMGEQYLDVLLPPIEGGTIAYLLRVNRRVINRGQLQVQLRSILSDNS